MENLRKWFHRFPTTTIVIVGHLIEAGLFFVSATPTQLAGTTDFLVGILIQLGINLLFATLILDYLVLRFYRESRHQREET